LQDNPILLQLSANEAQNQLKNAELEEAWKGPKNSSEMEQGQR